MKKKFLILFFAFTFGSNLYGQNPLVKQWDKDFGGLFDEFLTSFQQTTDGGYILSGYSNSRIGGDKTQDNWDTTASTFDYWVIKIDSFGTKQWDKRFGGIGDDQLSSLIQTKDGGYLLGGFSLSDNSGDKTEHSRGQKDYWVVKIDSIGNKQWDKRFGGNSNDVLTALEQISDGGYVLGGYSISVISGDQTQTQRGMEDYWILKIDSNGSKQWDKRFGGNLNDELYSVIQSSDKGFILGGWSMSDSSGDKTQPSWGGPDYWVVKIDSNGNKEWDKRFGGSAGDKLLSLQQTDDTGYVLSGLSISEISGDKTQLNCGGISAFSYDMWIVKIDSLGNKQWDKVYGGNLNEDEFGYIKKTSDSGYLISGTSYSPISCDKTENNMGSEQSWIIKTDWLGNKQWDKTIFTQCHDESGFSIQTKDGGYVVANNNYEFTGCGIGGYKTQPNWSFQGSDYWIIKFCDTTSTTSISENTSSATTVLIYPNPVTTKLNFFLKNNNEIIITNTLGEIVLQKELVGKVELDVSLLSTGIYFIKVGNEVSKFVKQ